MAETAAPTRKQLLPDNETEQEITYTWLARKVKPFGRPGQVSTRKLSPETGWVASVLYSRIVEGTEQVNFTTFIVKDKEFEQSYQARNWMNERMSEIFDNVEA